jgi:DNA invertase Pin-like site-specific DNA recombinase
MKRAAIYVRVSRAYQEGEDRVTIEAQTSECEAYCKQRGYTIIGLYVDKDRYKVKGKLVHPSAVRKDRPGYVKMLKAAKAGEIDVIIAWKEDRLIRGMYSALPLSEVIEESKGALTVELVRENFDIKMLGIKAAIAKMEVDNIRERMLMGKRVRLERGELPGGATRYGYSKSEDNRLLINQAEVEIIHKIIGWYLDGEDNMAIRRRLNILDVPARKAKVWSKATIQNILTFEGYATGEFTSTLENEMFTIECPPIISIDTWHRIVARREKNKKHRGRNVKEDYLCRGITKCVCGWVCGVNTSHAVKKKAKLGKWGYYRCAKREHQPEQRHPHCFGTMGAKKVDSYVWNYVVNICRNPEIVHAAIDAKIEQLQAEETYEQEAESLQRELDNLQQERDWVITQCRKGRITDEDMDMQLTALHFQALDLRKRHNDAVAAASVKTQAEQLKAWAAEYLSSISKGIDVLNTDPADFTKEQRDKLYRELEATRFEDKFEGDQAKALAWALFEERRRMVRGLVEEVLIVQEGKEKKIFPKLVLEIPSEFASLAYGDQSLDYKPPGLEERLQERIQSKSED